MGATEEHREIERLTALLEMIENRMNFEIRLIEQYGTSVRGREWYEEIRQLAAQRERRKGGGE